VDLTSTPGVLAVGLELLWDISSAETEGAMFCFALLFFCTARCSGMSAVLMLVLVSRTSLQIARLGSEVIEKLEQRKQPWEAHFHVIDMS
jgi:hypothetical protein